MLAWAPLTGLHCVLSSYPILASGSLLILQVVSEWLALRRVVYAVRPLAQMFDAGRLCWHVPL